MLNHPTITMLSHGTQNVEGHLHNEWVLPFHAGHFCFGSESWSESVVSHVTCPYRASCTVPRGSSGAWCLSGRRLPSCGIRWGRCGHRWHTADRRLEGRTPAGCRAGAFGSGPPPGTGRSGCSQRLCTGLWRRRRRRESWSSTAKTPTLINYL